MSLLGLPTQNTTLLGPLQELGHAGLGVLQGPLPAVSLGYAVKNFCVNVETQEAPPQI